jgi:hypothetical protein
MKDFWQTITTHLTLLPFIDKCYREFECRLISDPDIYRDSVFPFLLEHVQTTIGRRRKE